MKDYNVSMVEAMDFDFDIAMIDVSSVLAMCDYLEEQLGDLDFVEAMSMIYNGQISDYVIAKETQE
jgi:hypothetical protein